jgi:hypothetical protein
MSAEELARHKTDGHMDVAAVRAGATIVCPVKVPGGGVYLGDMHALQGDGEIAGHTCDVAGHAMLQVDVLKGLSIDGPILFPVDEDLPFLARAMPRRERNSAIEIAKSHGIKELERNLPISFIGTGKDLNLAIDNGLERAADFLQMSVPDVKTVQRFSAALRSAEARELLASRSAPPLRLLRELACELWPRRFTERPKSRPIVPENSTRVDSRDEPESAHDAFVLTFRLFTQDNDRISLHSCPRSIHAASISPGSTTPTCGQPRRSRFGPGTTAS